MSRPATATQSAHQAWTLVLASLGLFMVALDTLVVTTALPVLRVDLGASLSELEWTVNAYNLAFACFLLTGAALGDRFGRRRMFGIGLFVFTAASAAAALSPTVTALIAARTVQGIGAAMVMPLTLTLISEAFPEEKRGAAIGLWGGISGLAVAAGPVVGGAVIDGIDWHWIFWLNVPIGLVLIPLSLSRLTESYGPRPRLDPIGLLLAGTGFLSMTWGLVRANSIGWSSTEVVVTLIAGAALIAAFVAWERRAPSPMIPLRLFRSRGFSAANAVSFFMYAGLFGAVFLMAQFLQTGLGDSPLGAGFWAPSRSRRPAWPRARTARSASWGASSASPSSRPSSPTMRSIRRQVRSSTVSGLRSGSQPPSRRSGSSPLY
jgi:EmrB/QacA subfamily drug resistance transporter